MSTIDEQLERLTEASLDLRIRACQQLQSNRQTEFAEMQCDREAFQLHHEEFNATLAEIKRVRIEHSRILDQLEARDNSKTKTRRVQP
jgi:hypothetical protein